MNNITYNIYDLIYKYNNDIFGTIGGAAIGSVTQGKLGDHNGFQYIIDIDNNENDSAIVQGDKNSLENGQRVVIIYGNDIRVMPYEE